MIKTRERLPAPFLRLWGADALSSFGDGFTLIAAPLLLTTLTDNPVLIAGGVFASQVPWVLFGLHAGAVVDRADQRRLVIRVDTVRALLMAALAVTILTGSVTVLVVYLLLFASGAGDTLVLTAGTTLVPQLVAKHQLTRANSRLLSTRLLGALLIARPVGAWLFTAGHATPFVIDAVSFVAGAALLVRLPTRREHVDVPASGAVREGLQILWRDRVLRVLALCIFVMNVTLTGTMAVLVIYAFERLGLGPTGYGALVATMAIGGLIGAVSATRLVTRFGPSVLLKVGLAIECAFQLTLAVTTHAWVVAVALAVFGVHASVWTVLTVSLRQHRTEDAVRGRVMAAYTLLSVGGSAIGALAGGALVAAGGITTPMWVGAALVAGVFVLATPALRKDEVTLETQRVDA